MQTRKMYERINDYRKEFVFEQYTRIVENFKDYEKISKRKMLEAIYQIYSDYNNIIDICTTRELKYLKMVVDCNLEISENFEIDKIDYLDSKYGWEREMLFKKFLIQRDFDRQIYIPEEIVEQVKEAVKHVKWNLQKKIDSLNEILVSYCKIQGSALLNTVTSFASGITGIAEDVIWNHMLNNRLFNYYVYIISKDFESLGKNIPVAIYQDYYNISDELDEERKKQGIVGSKQIDIRMYKTLFYNDFDIHNRKIKKFLEEIKKLPFFWFSAIGDIRNFAVLNIDRTPLKQSIASVPILKDYDLTIFFEILDEAMDEMPSGALNGFTPNEAKKIHLEEAQVKNKKEQSYVKQKDAHLSSSDKSLFYKIYFALLEFTNRKYKINLTVKIYNNKKGINPYEINEIVETFWKNKDTIVLELCLANPYKFNKEELQIASEFKKGIRDIIIIHKYEENYTAMMTRDKIYMVKGLSDNIDNIVSYQKLPYTVRTSIIPFKNVLVYDGILLEIGIKMGNDFEKVLERKYQNAMKYYHL